MSEAEKLKKKIKELEEENKHLKKENEKIKREFEEFKAKHTQTVSELRKALKIKANKPETGKPVGAQKGHEAYTRHIPERIDIIKILNSRKCVDCGRLLPKET